MAEGGPGGGSSGDGGPSGGGDGDGGSSSPLSGQWAAIASGTTERLTAVASFDGSVVLAAGDNRTLLRSTDGGTTWKLSQLPAIFGTSQRINAVVFANANVVYAVGDWGLAAKSTDAGATWSLYNFGSGIFGAYNLATLWAVDDKTVFAPSQNGRVWVTRNGNASWQELQMPFPASLTGMSCANASRCLVTGGAGFFFTSDGGTTWSQLAVAPGVIVDQTRALGGDRFVGLSETRVLKSTDAALTWVPVFTPSLARLLAIDFASASAGLVVGASGTVLRTRNGGETWTSESSGTTEQLYAVRIVDESLAFAVGSKGVLLRYR